MTTLTADNCYADIFAPNRFILYIFCRYISYFYHLLSFGSSVHTQFIKICTYGLSRFLYRMNSLNHACPCFINAFIKNISQLYWSVKFHSLLSLPIVYVPSVWAKNDQFIYNLTTLLLYLRNFNFTKYFDVTFYYL